MSFVTEFKSTSEDYAVVCENEGIVDRDDEQRMHTELCALYTAEAPLLKEMEDRGDAFSFAAWAIHEALTNVSDSILVVKTEKLNMNTSQKSSYAECDVKVSDFRVNHVNFCIDSPVKQQRVKSALVRLLPKDNSILSRIFSEFVYSPGHDVTSLKFTIPLI